MAGKLRKGFRGIAAPALVREPLLIRMCSAFVNNLTLLLRIAFIGGVIFFVQDFRSLTDEFSQPVAEIDSDLAAPEVNDEPADAPELQKPLLTEGVMQALNCTYRDYRNAHYTECVGVDAPSKVYPSPHANPDDTGSVTHHASAVQFARLDGDVGLGQTSGNCDVAPGCSASSMWFD